MRPACDSAVCVYGDEYLAGSGVCAHASKARSNGCTVCGVTELCRKFGECAGVCGAGGAYRNQQQLSPWCECAALAATRAVSPCSLAR